MAMAVEALTKCSCALQTGSSVHFDHLKSTLAKCLISKILFQAVFDINFSTDRFTSSSGPDSYNQENNSFSISLTLLNIVMIRFC